MDRNVGIRLCASSAQEAIAAEQRFHAHLARGGLEHIVTVVRRLNGNGPAVDFRLADACAATLTPDHDTTGLRPRLLADGGPARDLDCEILVAMLASPVAFEFPNCDELFACLRMRRNIAAAAAHTALAFDTRSAERPEAYWHYDPERGFVVRPGCSVIDALRCATQPDCSGSLYSFSCYRATEYVILLGIAQELAAHNPALLDRLQRQCETRVIRSAQFHDCFLVEYGSMEAPLPPHYYVPGDRLWFRNPDEPSSDITGYEGSWVFYLGGGEFSNFWKVGQPYTLTSKCLEIYHWRHGAHRDSTGQLAMDEALVEARVLASQADPCSAAAIVERMMRLRDPRGVYAEGGCIDTTREYPRCVCPGTADLGLPMH